MLNETKRKELRHIIEEFAKLATTETYLKCSSDAIDPNITYTSVINNGKTTHILSFDSKVMCLPPTKDGNKED